MTELGTRWPEEFTEEHGSEMLDVISELEELLGTLSLLGRAESEASAKRDLVDLEGVVGEQIERVLPRMEERGIEIEKMVEKSNNASVCNALKQRRRDSLQVIDDLWQPIMRDAEDPARLAQYTRASQAVY